MLEREREREREREKEREREREREKERERERDLVEHRLRDSVVGAIFGSKGNVIINIYVCYIEREKEREKERKRETERETLSNIDLEIPLSVPFSAARVKYQSSLPKTKQQKKKSLNHRQRALCSEFNSK